MGKLLLGLAVGTALTLAASGASAANIYDIAVTTSYQYGAPPGNQGPYSGGPDTGFITISNNGPTAFTGTLGDTAVTSGGTDYSLSFNSVTLNPGQSFTFGTSPESSNVGGFNGPFGSPQPGIDVLINGNIAGFGAVNFSVYDSNIHSGTINGGGVTDAYVLQGGCPTGCDYGDAIETTQANGVYTFSLAAPGVPEPAAWATMITGLFGVGSVMRRSRRSGAPALA